MPFHPQSPGRFTILPDIPLWVKTLAEHNGCRTNPVSLPGNGSVSGVYYQADTNHADVVFYTVTGGGHTWPGGKTMPVAIVGKTTADVDATRLMWDFFVAHPLPR